MADNFNMKQFLAENKLGPYAKNPVVENQYDDEDEDYDLNAAFKASPMSHSYEDVLDIFKSYEDESILNNFKAKFPEGKDISRKDYGDFAMSMIDDMSEVSFIQANWISLTDDDVYTKAGLVEEKEKLAKEDYAGAEEEKMMDFLAEYEVIYVVQNGKCYRKDDEGNMDQVDMSKCRMYAENKKEEVKENISPEAYERMASLTNLKAQQAMIKAAEIMMNELTEEGFEVEEIREFFTQLITNDI